MHCPAHRHRRLFAHQRGIHHGAQRIHIGPRALAQRSGIGVLLDRCIAGLEDGGEGLGGVTDHLPGGAKIEQQRPAVAGQQQDVVGCDVTVQAVRGMHHGQRLGQCGQQGHQPALVGWAGQVLQRQLQRGAFVKRHHHVGRAVVLPEAVHLDQRRVVKLGQQPRLVDEADQAGVEHRAVAPRHPLDRLAGGAAGQGRRHVLLDGHPAPQ